MTPAQQIAWHRLEADRIEAEERARRPALAAGQVWREPESDTVWIACANDYLINPDSGGFWSGARSSLEYVGLARDVLRVVPPGSEEVRHSGPDTPITVQIAPQVAPSEWVDGPGYGNGVTNDLDRPSLRQVAPEPTGAELVGRRCWVTAELGGSWLGPVEIVEFDGSSIAYRATQRIDGSHWFYDAKPYIEGVEP